MFGLSDNNSNNNYSDTTQVSGSGSVQEEPRQPLSAGGPLPPTTAQNNDYTTSMPQANTSSQPGATSFGSSSADSNQAQPPASPGMGDVNLENAYIATDPAVSANDNSSPRKDQPTAASLVNGFNEDELLKLKQQALQSLAPLVDHLEQDPEAKFKTTMMMIQASDNSDLIPEAYEAANKIPDEKVRAQALLDVVNEINYFTQHPATPNTPQQSDNK
jgi:hypothetical protein